MLLNARITESGKVNLPRDTKASRHLRSSYHLRSEGLCMMNHAQQPQADFTSTTPCQSNMALKRAWKLEEKKQPD